MKKYAFPIISVLVIISVCLLIAGCKKPANNQTTPEPTSTSANSPTDTPSGDPTEDPGEIRTAEPSDTPAPSATAAPTAAPTETPDITATPSASPESSPEASVSPSASTSPEVSATPSASPETSPEPSKTPLKTSTPTPKPTNTPTPKPTKTPTPKPTNTPTPKPTPTPVKDVVYQIDNDLLAVNVNFEEGKATSKYVHSVEDMGIGTISHLSATTDAKIITGTNAIAGSKSLDVRGYLGARFWGVSMMVKSDQYIILELTFKMIKMNGEEGLYVALSEPSIPESNNNGTTGWVFRISGDNGKPVIKNRLDQVIYTFETGKTYTFAAAFLKGYDSYDFFVNGKRVSTGNKWLGPVKTVDSLRLETLTSRDKDANGYSTDPLEFVIDDFRLAPGYVLREGEAIPTPTPVPTPTPRPQNAELNPVYDADAGTPYLKETSAKKYSGSPITQFLLSKDLNPAFPFSISCSISGSEITAVIPAGIDLSSVKVKFTSSDTVYCNNVKLVSGTSALDLRTPKTLVVEKAGGSKTNMTLKVETIDTGLPSISVVVDNFGTVNSKTDYVGCTVYAGGGDPDSCYYAMDNTVYTTAQVKCRGNSSFWYNLSKKSYTLKLENKASLCGIEKSKNWALVANCVDKSLIRNLIGADLAKAVGLEYVMEVRSVDLWLNGEYWGNYVLAEKIEIEKARVNITDYKDGIPVDQLGYLLQWEGHVGDTTTLDKWITTGGTDYYVHWASDGYNYLHLEKPGESHITQEMLDYIYNYIHNLHKALERENYAELSKMMDMESFAKWYIVEDYMMNTDSGFWCSCWMYLQDGVIHMGPVWDFDNSLGNNNTVATNSYLGTSGYYKHLLAMPEFKALLKSVWNECKDRVQAVAPNFDIYETLIHQSRIYNYELEEELKKRDPSIIVKDYTYEEDFAALKTFFNAKFKYYDYFIDSLK